MRAALEALDTIASVAVSRSGADDQGGYVWRCTFTDNFNSGDVAQPTADGSGLSGTADVVSDGADAVALTASDGNELSGTFTLELNGQTTGPIDFDASASAFKAAVQDDLGPGMDVTVYRTGPDYERGYTWQVSFLSTEGDIDEMVVDDSGLVGSGAVGSVTETRKGVVKEVQLLQTTGTSDINATAMFALRVTRGSDTAVTGKVRSWRRSCPAPPTHPLLLDRPQPRWQRRRVRPGRPRAADHHHFDRQHGLKRRRQVGLLHPRLQARLLRRRQRAARDV